MDGDPTPRVSSSAATDGTTVGVASVCVAIGGGATVDVGGSVGAVTDYTFSTVTEGHTIEVQFAINTYTITASVVGANGTIDPVGIFMKAIVAALVSDIIDNQDAAGHTDCETGDINE